MDAASPPVLAVIYPDFFLINYPSTRTVQGICSIKLSIFPRSVFLLCSGVPKTSQTAPFTPIMTRSVPATQSDTVSILSLPLEILHQIIALIHGIEILDPATWINKAGLVVREGDTGAEEQAAARLEIQRLRLVCRLFKNVASPYLVPYVTVRISPESLERLEGLCISPAVARGIRGLQLDLRYHPRELAADADLFGQLRVDEARYLLRRCDYHKDGIEMAGPPIFEYDYDYEDGLGLYKREDGARPWLDEREHGNYCNAPEDYCRLGDSKCRATRTLEVVEDFLTGMCLSEPARVFSSEPLLPAEDRASEDEMHRNRRIFLDAYREFGRKSEVEARMIEDGSFFRRIVAAVSQMKNGTALRFDDGGDEFRTTLGFDAYEILTWQTDDDKFSEYLQQSVSWLALDQCFKGGIPAGGRDRLKADFKVEPARLMYDLPIALHEAGFRIRHLYIAATMPPRGVPGPNNDDKPGALPVLEAAAGRVSRLRAATQDLKGLLVMRSAVGYDARVFRSWRGGDEAFGLLAGLLSGERDRLECLSIGLYNPVIMEEDDQDAGPVSALQMGRDIGTVASLACVRDFFLGWVTIRQEALEGICAALGDSLRDVHIRDTMLVGRSWANVMEILREKVAISQRVSGRNGDACRSRLSELSGGEFGDLREWHEEGDFSTITQGYQGQRAPGVIAECCKYINGAGGDENPLRRTRN